MLENEKVEITKSELEEIVYKFSRKASDNLYKGLCRAFFDRYDQDLRTIIQELDYIKLCLRNREERRPLISDIPKQNIEI